MNPFESKTLLLGLAAFALGLGVSTFASAQTPSKKDSSDRYTYVPFAGQSVAIDRQTGKLRPPTPDEARQLGAALKNYLNRSSQGLVVKTHPNGMQSVDLQGRFQSVSLAKINPDGSTSERCVTNMREAQDFLTGTPSKQKPPGRSIGGSKTNHAEEK
jgi:hypothetical protein